LLPFELHTSADFVHHLEIELDGLRVRVFPPFKDGPGLQLHRSLVNESLPFLPGTSKPSSRLPNLELNGAAGWPKPFFLCDALRVDVQGLDESASKAVAEIGRRLLRLVRFVTRQWWIMRGASESLSPLQNAFRIDSWGQPLGGTLYRTAHILPWLGSEVLVDQATFGASLAYLEQGVTAPSSAMTLLDSVFASTHGDKEQGVLLAAIACESLFSTECFQAVQLGMTAASTAKKFVKQSDLRQRFHFGALAIFGRSFSEDRPASAAWLGRLWLARHAIAHFSPRQLEMQAILHDQGDFANAMHAAFSFFEWFAQVRYRAENDPMRQFVRPFVTSA